jgi:hypothetical protein
MRPLDRTGEQHQVAAVEGLVERLDVLGDAAEVAGVDGE